MSKHTPGPWEVRGPDGTGWQVHAHVPSLDRATTIEQIPIRPTVSISDDGKVYVCLSYEDWRQFPSDDWREMQAANARLIAAAAELYEALGELVACHEGGGFVEPDASLLAQARAAIAKAEGRS